MDSTHLECMRMENSKYLETLEIEDAGGLVEENDVVLNFCDNGHKVGNAIVVDQEVKVRKNVEYDDFDAKVGLKKCNAAGFEKFPSLNCGVGMGKTDSVQMIMDKSCHLKTELFVEVEGMEEGKAVELENVDSSAKTEVSEDICSFLSDSSGINLDGAEFLNVVMNEEISTKAEDEMQVMENGDKNRFSVGDIIWVRTKSQKWWPGKINNIVEASKCVDNDQRDCFTVYYLGNNYITKRFAFQLKPFHENFKQFSQNIKSKGFLKALKEAVNEFSVHYFVPTVFLSHIKSLASVVSASNPLELAATTNQLSAAYQFLGRYQLPAHQLDDPNRAHDVHGKKVQFTVLCKQSDASQQKNLSKETNESLIKVSDGSYDSGVENFGSIAAEKKEIGEKNRRKRRIKEVEDIDLSEMTSCGDENENGQVKMEFKLRGIDCGSEGKYDEGHDSRARKKSKYLSYPYINLEQKAVLESGESHSLESRSISKRSGLNFWRIWYHKFASCGNMTSDPELANASSVEFLSELHFAAMDLCYPKGNKNFHSIALFFSKFRMSIFHDESVYTAEDLTAETLSSGSNLIESKKKISQPAAKTEKRKRKGQDTSSSSMAKSENGSEMNHPCMMEGLSGNPTTFLDSESLNMDILSPKIDAKGKKIRSKRSKTKCLSGLSDVDTSITASSIVVNDSLNHNPKQKKRKKDAAAGIPDLNGINSSSNLLPEDEQAMSNVACLDKSRKKKRNKRDEVVNNPQTTCETLDVSDSQQPDSFFIDLQAVPQSIDELTQQNGLVGKERPSFILDFGLLTDSNSFPETGEQEIDLKAPAESNFWDKKRKRQKKATSKPPNTKFPAGIPDLNGNTIEPNPSAKEQMQNGTSPQPKPKRGRRKKGEGNITNDNQITALHLTFSSSNGIPSKEDFITIFSRFRPLKESDINIMEDSSTARIIFLKSEDAGGAIQSLDQDNPFGTNLVKYQLLPDATSKTLASPPLEDYMTNLKLLRLTPSSGEAPALEFIRQNLHMMTVMLEKSGTNLSPEMRAKLEDEIRGLLKKLSSTDGSSSA